MKFTLAQMFVIVTFFCVALHLSNMYAASVANYWVWKYNDSVSFSIPLK
jgi:hypothetical protein